MSRVNNSVLWEHFEKVDAVNKKAKCCVCGSLISFKTTTGNLKTHLKNRHIESYLLVANAQADQNASTTRTTRPLTPPQAEPSASQNMQTQDSTVCLVSQPSTSTVSTRKRLQTKLDTFIPKKVSRDQRVKIDNDLLGLFTKGFQPFSLVEEASFKKFARWIPGYDLPSRKQVSSVLIPRLYEKCKEEVELRLSNADLVEKICLTIDLWTSRANEAYLAITGHFITKTFEMESVLLGCEHFPERHTSANIQDFLSNTVRQWKIEEKINFVISDNATNVQKALTDLNWKHFGCYGHTLNLIVQSALTSVKDTLEKVKSIVQFFKKSTVATEKLLRYQKNENNSTIPLKLKQDMPTRWNSTLHMIARFVELQAAIKSTAAVIGKDLPIITCEEWILMEQLSIVLKPFDEITEAMSGEKYITSGSIIIITRCLIKTCDKLLAEHVTPLSDENTVSPAATVAHRLREGLKERLGNVEKSGTFSICTFLDPRYKTSGFEDKAEAAKTKKKIIDMVQSFIAKKSPIQPETQVVNETPVRQKGVSPWSILTEIISENRPQKIGTALSKAIQEVDMYLEDDLLPVHQLDGSWSCPLKWWQSHHQKYPNLSELFRQYGNILATSVPCERVFSKAGLLISDRRTRLDHKKVAQIMFIHGNT